jgi:hypothetical protein
VAAVSAPATHWPLLDDSVLSAARQRWSASSFWFSAASLRCELLELVPLEEKKNSER